ncbi:flavin reductase family protein [Streptomyces sp. Ag109_G2-15]|uniref:flavin reductase family protein n=1 Tax=Streptomyces sp. Ag109_G2-15 TaxID=1938850 RepID=UPI000BCF6361|nr:flavin reductase family protein [Streptomyces sp. Ag109_G2-15]SOE07562.1 NADH-FMN oxidoreductase RutF, flavin reductase (DIM6/NTAB) family [Streptomyces sp. Ag109_G2-15]
MPSIPPAPAVPPPPAPSGVPLAPALRAAFSQLPTGVTVITTTTAAGPAGVTASAVCSLSLDPPLVLLGIGARSQTLERIRSRGNFLVNVLPVGASATASAFAAPGTSPEARFTAVPWHTYEDMPALDDALAWVACSVERTYPGGDHVIVIGRALDCRHRDGQPLVRHAGRYRQLA